MKQKEAVYLANSYIYRTHGPKPVWDGLPCRLDLIGASLRDGLWRVLYEPTSFDDSWLVDGATITVLVDDKTGETFHPN